MNKQFFRTTLAGIAMTISAAAAIGGSPSPEPTPEPQIERAAATVKAVISGFDVNKNYGSGSMAAVVTVSNFKTGKPAINLARTNFSFVFVPVNGASACSSNPVIGAFYSTNPGIYVATLNLPQSCAQVWPKGQYPVAVIVTSTNNPLNPSSPLSYEGQSVVMAEVK